MKKCKLLASHTLEFLLCSQYTFYCAKVKHSASIILDLGSYTTTDIKGVLQLRYYPPMHLIK